jgi:hypothetical protein
MRRDIVLHALEQALFNRQLEREAHAGIDPFVGSRGDSYENALVETIFYV